MWYDGEQFVFVMIAGVGGVSSAGLQASSGIVRKLRNCYKQKAKQLNPYNAVHPATFNQRMPHTVQHVDNYL